MKRIAGCLLALLLLSAVPGGARAQDPAAAESSDLAEALRKLVALRDDHGLLQRAERELESHPRSVLGLQYRAYALERLGRTKDAFVAYAALIDVAPRHAWGLTQLARLRAEAGRPDAAETLYRRAIEADPATTEARYALASILRTRGLASESVVVVRDAIGHDDDTARAQAELGYALWCNQSHDDARRAWKAARASGHDPVACERALTLILHDQATLPAGRKAAREARARRAGGEPWTLTFGNVTVVTRVGPRLTEDVEELLRTFPARIAAYVDGGPGEDGAVPDLPEVVIHLARTREEHEASRRKLFPRGPKDKAFLLRAMRGRGPGPGRGPRGPGRSVPAEIHACWFPTGLTTSLTHELTHSVVQDRARFLPTWADEGLATYVEPVPGAPEDADWGAPRADLLATLESTGDALDLSRLLRTPSIGFQGSRRHYAAAWSLVHFLIHGHPKGARGFRTLLKAWDERRGADPRTFERVYGKDLETVQKQWERHVRKLREEL